MLFKKKPKLPITAEDQIWVEESLSFLKERLGETSLLEIPTVVLSADFFPREFDGTEADAQHILQQCMALMDIPEGKVLLEYYSEENRYLDDGTLLSSSADIFGKSAGAAGTYQKQKGKAIIRIERGQLKHTETLVATIAHELSHEKLLGEGRIIQNDEYLTDLTAIVYGFGIFIANAKFQFSAGGDNGFGWQMKSQGYLPEQISAYAMASLSLKKKEQEHPYLNQLGKSVRNYFEQSLAFLQSGENEKDPSLFWQRSQQTVAEQTLERIGETKEVAQKEVSKETRERLQKELARACLEVDLDTAGTLLAQGVDPNYVGLGGSPLSMAVMRNSITLIELLLRYGADLNFSDSDSMMDKFPLMVACKDSNHAMMQYLIDLGALVNVVSGNGESVLQVAVNTGNTETVDFLLERGAHIEIRSGSWMGRGETPICAAVWNNDTEMVSFLAKKGAKTKPIRKLKRHEMHPKMVKFLKSRKYL